MVTFYGLGEAAKRTAENRGWTMDDKWHVWVYKFLKFDDDFPLSWWKMFEGDRRGFDKYQMHFKDSALVYHVNLQHKDLLHSFC